MAGIKDIFAAAGLRELHFTGIFLCLSIIFIPAVNVLLYPFGEENWQPILYFSLISLVEIIFIVIFLMERRHRNYPVKHLPAILWAAFLVWALVALLNIPGMILPFGGAIVTVMFLIHFFFFVALSSYLKCQPDTGAKLMASIILSSLLFLPVFWLKLWVIYDQTDFDWVWTMPGFTNVRHMDYFLCSIVVTLGLMPTIRDRFRTLVFPLLLGLWIMLFWSGGRGASVAAASSIGIILFFFRPDGWRQLALFNFSALLMGAMLSLLLPIPNDSYGLIRFANKMDNVNVFTAGRMMFWAQAIDIWRQNPWFGIGAGQTKAVIKSALGVYGQPHNVILQAMMAWGLVGGVPFLAAISGVLRVKVKQFRAQVAQENKMVFVAYGLALSTLINALVDGTLYYPFPVFLFTIAVSVMGMTGINPDNQDRYPPPAPTG